MSSKTPPTPYVPPKATRNGKAVVKEEPKPAPAKFDALKWLGDWPKPTATWEKLADNLYRLQVEGMRLEVFSKMTEHSTKNAVWGFNIHGVYGPIHSEPAVSFEMRDAQEAAVKCVNWINNNKLGEPPYTCAIPKPPRTEQPRPRRPVPRPLPRPMPPVTTLPILMLPPPTVVDMNDTSGGTGIEPLDPPDDDYDEVYYQEEEYYGDDDYDDDFDEDAEEMP